MTYEVSDFTVKLGGFCFLVQAFKEIIPNMFDSLEK